MRLFTKILLFFISLVIALSVVTTYSGINSIEHIAVNELEKGLTSDINLFTFAIEREIERIESHLTLVAMQEDFKKALAEQDLPLLRHSLENVLHDINIDILNLDDSKGEHIVGLRRRMKSTPAFPDDIKAQDAVRKGFTLLDTESGKRLALFVSVPLVDRQKFHGNISGFALIDQGSIFLNTIAEILSRKRDEPVYISIFHGAKRVFTTIGSLTGTHAQDLRSEVTYTLYKTKRNYIGRTLIGSTSYFTIYAPYNASGGESAWAYGIAVNENIFFPYKKRLLFIFITISSVAASAAIIIAFLITREINPSLGRIVDICSSIEKGDMQSRIDTKAVKLKEFFLIASSINKMMDGVTEREAIIKEKMEAIADINAELNEKSTIIREERKRFLSMLETMDAGLATINTEGAITYFNGAAEVITGISRQVVVGSHYREIFPSLIIRSNDSNTIEELVLEHPISPIYLKINVSPFILGSEEQGHIILMQDISKQKKVEEFKADFVSSIAHDIKSFLMPASGFLSRLMKEKYGHLEEPVKEKLHSIEENISKIHHLVENYLNISKIESGTIELNPVPTDLAKVILDIAHLYGSRVHYTGNRNIPPVMADVSNIERVLANLVANAIKFSPKDSSIRLSTRKEGIVVVTSVQDDGVGIPSGELPYIFERYRRGSFAKQEEGAGLGLFIVKSIIEAHGGSIWVESKQRKGTTFYFTLPIAES